MFTQIARTLPRAILFITLGSLFLSMQVFSQTQSYHPVIHSVKEVNSILDSMAAPHLQVHISQPDKNYMKFRIVISSPVSRYITITIKKQNDIYFSEMIATTDYENIYDLNQLEDGNYQVQIIGGKEKVLKNISIHTQTQVSRQAMVD
jgi:outer membrane lipoprotein-sorting protein